MGTNPNPYGGNAGGVGGSRRRIQSNVPRGKTSHRASGGGGGHKKKGCCSMVAALGAARRGKYRLARRYAVRSVRQIGARIAQAA